MSHVIGQSFTNESSPTYSNNTVRLSSYETDADKSEQSPITLLFIHGLESSKETWLPVIEKLRNAYRIIAIDLRGHGETPIGNEDFSIRQLIADIEQFVKEKNLHQFVMIGHSMGARVAIPYAVKHPEQIQALVIEDMEVLERPKEDIDALEIQHLKQFHSTHSNLDEVKKELEKYGYPPEKLESWLKQGRIKQVIDTESYFIGVNPYFSYLMRQSLSSSDCALNAFEELHKLELPVLLLKAEVESSVSAKGLEQMQNILPAMLFKEVTGSSHSIHKTAQEEFISLIKLFLENIKSVGS
jgi:pimeloyl-ACP methyl ester carboxylesterase